MTQPDHTRKPACEEHVNFRSGDGLRLFAFRFHGLELAEHSPNRPEGVRLVMPESLEVCPQRVTGHLEFLFGEMDGGHATILVL